jgi:hypothetical protein
MKINNFEGVASVGSGIDISKLPSDIGIKWL